MPSNGGISLRKGNAKSSGPKHQNRFAFKHNKNSKKTEAIDKVPIIGVCQRCKEILEWRRRFRKYKLAKDARKCAQCSAKTVTMPYHVVCKPCAISKKICAKCLHPRSSEFGLSAGEKLNDDQFLQLLAEVDIKERQRRVVIRAWERGLIQSRSQVLSCVGELQSSPGTSQLRLAPEKDEDDDGDEEEGDEEEGDDEGEEIGRAVQQECRDRSRMPSSA
eukprot:TRINITY_DN4550_c0_g1_i2.p1 TRINITY_DN4550_c0_g1~~TRINITY_DN4550_c0_g1_i2.p1  ORF type:complete len:219 (+),score=30.03 TRINITY_DN4550_c0_g1_i2:100-756(+)